MNEPCKRPKLLEAIARHELANPRWYPAREVAELLKRTAPGLVSTAHDLEHAIAEDCLRRFKVLKLDDSNR
jgi:hypothetical protein